MIVAEAANPEQPFETEPGLDQHYSVLRELGDCYAGTGNYDRARQCYRRAASLSPEEASPYVGLGVIAVQTEQLDEARAAFEIARRLDSRCAEAWSGLAMVYQQRKEYQAAFEHYLTCLELDTDNLVALLGLFQTSCQMGTFSKIIHYLEVFVDQHPGDTSVLFCLATLYARDGRLEEAREALTTVLTIEPGKQDARRLLGEVESKLQARGQLKAVAG
jgi:tetratricopeptide (TPR) repeat protein